jgi:hypothetical protein
MSRKVIRIIETEVTTYGSAAFAAPKNRDISKDVTANCVAMPIEGPLNAGGMEYERDCKPDERLNNACGDDEQNT